MLYAAGVRRCYGIVGDALNPTIDALRRQGSIEFVHVRHEEFGVFAAVADSCLTGQPTAVCGTAGPGAAHLINGLLDARKEGAPVIAIAGDVDSAVIDSDIVEELNPYKFFDAAALYIGRLINPAQLRTVVTMAVSTAIAERGPVVIAMPGDVAASDLPHGSLRLPLPAARTGLAVEDDLAAMAELINSAATVTIFRGQGCAGAEAEVMALADKLSAPVGYTLRGKQWIEAGNPNAVGMTGLIGYGGAYHALHDADVLVILGADFPFPEFLPQEKVKVVQIDRDARHLGRRAPLELAVTGDVKATLGALLSRVNAKPDRTFLDKHRRHSRRLEKPLRHYVEAGPRIKPIRPEYVAATLSELADNDALFFADTGTACIWTARYLELGGDRRLFGSFSWASMANASPNAFGAQLAFPGRQTIAICGDGGFTMLGLGEVITEVQRKMPVVHVILNNSMLDFVNIEEEEAGLIPFGTDLKTRTSRESPRRWAPKESGSRSRATCVTR
jgi:pyruvate dehydrogenase (quinone)